MALLDALKRADLPDASGDDFGDDFDTDFPADLRGGILSDPAPGASRAAPSSAASSSPSSSPSSGSSSTSSKAAPKAARRPVSRQVKRQVADELEAYAQLTALAWSTRDEQCAGVLSDQSRAIADALAEIIARNPRLLELMSASGLVGDWVKLAMAIMPVVTAVRDHHIVRKVEDPAGGVGVALDYSKYAAYRPTD